MNHLSLFSGYEGFGLGLKLTGLPIKTVGYCEKEKYCQEIIRQRIRDGFLDDAPIWPDVRDFPGHLFAGCVDVLTAGFPCQPHSVAGKRRGKDDKRNLWPDTLRIIGEVGPQWVLLENVPGILTNGFGGTVVGQLSEIGYDCRWGIISAADVGANHVRKRWWVLAYPHQPRGQSGEVYPGNELASFPRREAGSSIPSGQVPHSDSLRLGDWEPKEYPTERGVDALGQSPGLRGEVADSDSERWGRTWPCGHKPPHPRLGHSGEDVADTKGPGLEGGRASELREGFTGLERSGSDVAQSLCQSGLQAGSTISPVGSGRESRRDVGGCSGSCQSRVGWWEVEPELGRVANGVARRVDRLTAIGGGIVPAVVAEFWAEFWVKG